MHDVRRKVNSKIHENPELARVLALSVLSLVIVRITVYLAPDEAMGAARATHRQVWLLSVISLGVDNDNAPH
jgi:hypothetical protein